MASLLWKEYFTNPPQKWCENGSSKVKTTTAISQKWLVCSALEITCFLLCAGQQLVFLRF
jgi:hypothetical protein